MKFLISIFSLIFVLSAASVSAQKIYTMTGSADTVVNAEGYCTHFCHALHLEMRTRMIVEA